MNLPDIPCYVMICFAMLFHTANFEAHFNSLELLAKRFLEWVETEAVAAEKHIMVGTEIKT